MNAPEMYKCNYCEGKFDEPYVTHYAEYSGGSLQENYVSPCCGKNYTEIEESDGPRQRKLPKNRHDAFCDGCQDEGKECDCVEPTKTEIYMQRYEESRDK